MPPPTSSPSRPLSLQRRTPAPPPPPRTTEPQDETSDYLRRSQKHHREYTSAFTTWFDSLTPEERAKAAALGITKPLDDSSRVSGHGPGEDRDAADSPRARIGFDFSAVEESASPAAASTTSSDPWRNPDICLTIQRVVGMIISSDNALIATHALAFALNMDALNGLGSIRDAARKLGVSVEAISKKKRQWEQALDLPPNAFAKSPQAKLALSVAQSTKHWKNIKWKAPKTSKPQPKPQPTSLP